MIVSSPASQESKRCDETRIYRKRVYIIHLKKIKQKHCYTYVTFPFTHFHLKLYTNLIFVHIEIISFIFIDKQKKSKHEKLWHFSLHVPNYFQNFNKRPILDFGTSPMFPLLMTYKFNKRI